MVIQRQNKNYCFRENYYCAMTQNTFDIKEADAIVFFSFGNGFPRVEDVPPFWQRWKRRKDQIWILHVHEAPPNTSPITGSFPLPDFFNWSISYRRDSDIWLPYGRSLPNSNEFNSTRKEILVGNIPLAQWIKAKTKLVAAVISNCHTQSKRGTLVSYLKRTGIPVDVYGEDTCSDFRVNCSFYFDKCDGFWSNFAKTYKFYLAFENSLCVDYVTEKFWRSLELGMVPVVYGGADYGQIAPPNSFIDVRQFENAGHLMKFLNNLGNNETEFAKYFEWRNNFRIEAGNMSNWDNGNAWCQLCAKLRGMRAAFDSDNTKSGILEETSRAALINQVPRNWWRKKPNSEESACEDPDMFLKKFV